jgi:hypothetical protein
MSPSPSTIEGNLSPLADDEAVTERFPLRARKLDELLRAAARDLPAPKPKKAKTRKG